MQGDAGRGEPLTPESVVQAYYEIPLTKGKVALVDAKDFSLVSKYTWCAMWNGHNWYAVSRTGSTFRNIYMHRLIMGATEGAEVDHRRVGDTLDNRRGNLRVCTRSQNGANSRSKNSTGFKGVRKRNGRFHAPITSFKTARHLGVFNSLEEAARAYDKAAIAVFGEFARINFPALEVRYEP